MKALTLRFAVAAAAAVALVSPGALHAIGQQGRVIGVVTDTAGKPLEGVKIIITSSAVTTFKSEHVTDKAGKFEKLFIDAVPKYHYKFEKEGYAPYETDFKVQAGDMSAKLEVKMQNLEATKAAAQAQIKSKADPFVVAYNEAVEKFQAGDMDGALVKAEEAVTLGPDKANGYDLATKIARKKEDWDKVILYGEKASQLDPENNTMYGLVAEAYRSKGDKAKAAEWDKKYASANPDQPEVVLNQAIEKYNKGDFKGAEPLLLKVVEAQPDNAKAHFLVGMASVNLNKIDQMKKHLNEYIRLEPKGKDVGAAKEMLDAFK